MTIKLVTNEKLRRLPPKGIRKNGLMKKKIGGIN